MSDSLSLLRLRADTVVMPSCNGKKMAVPIVFGRKSLSRAVKRDIAAALLVDDPHCIYCGAMLSERSATLDHFVPLANGGPNDECNLLLSCSKCNTAKADRMPGEWMEYLYRCADSTQQLIASGRYCWRT